MSDTATSNKALDELIALRDEIKVKLHLASLETKTLWDQVSREIETLTSEKVRVAGHQAIETLRTKLKNVQDLIKKDDKKDD